MKVFGKIFIVLGMLSLIGAIVSNIYQIAAAVVCFIIATSLEIEAKQVARNGNQSSRRGC